MSRGYNATRFNSNQRNLCQMRESVADKKVRAKAIYRLLTKNYPNVRCELDYENPFQLLVATVLSAQCADKRVNQTTPALFKKYGTIDPVKSISNLQKYCSTTNIIKHKNTRGLTASFQDGKYALLLGKFIKFEIVNYEKNIDNDSDDKNNIYYAVDMKVSAEYKTMLQNSIQFNDMYYPSKGDNNNLCYIIYRWSFKKYEDGNLYLEGCFLIPPPPPQ
jgi:hypothetical protein